MAGEQPAHRTLSDGGTVMAHLASWIIDWGRAVRCWPWLHGATSRGRCWKPGAIFELLVERVALPVPLRVSHMSETKLASLLADEAAVGWRDA